MLYEVALVKKPTRQQEKDGKLEELILAPVTVIARDDKAASLQVVLNNKDKMPDDLSQIEVLVRPFA